MLLLENEAWDIYKCIESWKRNFPSLTHSSQALASSSSSRQAALCCPLICLRYFFHFSLSFPLFPPSWLSTFFQRMEASRSESLRSEAWECLSNSLEKQIKFKGFCSHTWHHFTYNLNLKCSLLSVNGMCDISGNVITYLLEKSLDNSCIGHVWGKYLISKQLTWKSHWIKYLLLQ